MTAWKIHSIWLLAGSALSASSIPSVLTDVSLYNVLADRKVGAYKEFFSFEAEGATPQDASCKVFPGDRGWPSAKHWQALDNVLDGSLIPTVPIGAPCYRNAEAFNEERCKQVVAEFGTTELHEADPTSMMWPIWQGRTCLPVDGTNGTCSLGGYPEYVVRVTTVAQIQFAINFARSTNIRLVIKNTGHCYLGKSGGAGALSLWMHQLRDIAYVEKYRSRDYTGPALKVGAGVRVREVYLAAKKFGGTAVGGVCPNIGFAGGYIQGGGHSALSSLLGFGADSVLAFEAVTASGRFITASPTENSDLFWALSGGGGSTYAVVTSATVKLHPKIPVTTSRFAISTSATVSKETFWLGARSFYDSFIPWTDDGAFVYFSITETDDIITLQLNPIFAPNHSLIEYEALVKPWTTRLTQLGIPFDLNTTYWPDYYEAYDNNFSDDNPIGSTLGMPGNRIFPKPHFADSVKLDHIFAAVRQTVEEGFRILAYANAPGARTSHVKNGVSSHYRDAVSMHITVVPLPPNATSGQLNTASQKLLQLLDRLGEAVSDGAGGGSYLNEAHVMELGWQEKFYGKQYARLAEIKRKWDPHRLFYATTGVGSDEWELIGDDQGVTTQNGRLCRV